MVTTKIPEKGIESRTTRKQLEKQFAWVLNRLLDNFAREQIHLNYTDSGNGFGVMVVVEEKGEKRRNLIKLKSHGACCFDQTPEDEEYLDKFIENLKA